MENLENPNKQKGTYEQFRITNPDGSVSSFETKEELDAHIEDLRDTNKTK